MGALGGLVHCRLIICLKLPEPKNVPAGDEGLSETLFICVVSSSYMFIWEGTCNIHANPTIFNY